MQAPLLSVPGVTLYIVCVDILHGWHLGGLGHFVGFACWALVKSGIWSRHIPGLVAADQYKVSLIMLKTLMWAHYKRRRLTDLKFKTSGSQVWNLTLKMLGTLTKPMFACKSEGVPGVA